MRLVVRIGGSVVASPVNTELMGRYADLVKAVRSQGHEVAVVVGGGALAREFIRIAKDLGLDMRAQDEIAISVSRLHAQLFLKRLGEVGCSKVAFTLDDVIQCLSEGKVAVMGGLKPESLLTRLLRWLPNELTLTCWLKAPTKKAFMTRTHGNIRTQLSWTV